MQQVLATYRIGFTSGTPALREFLFEVVGSDANTIRLRLLREVHYGKIHFKPGEIFDELRYKMNLFTVDSAFSNLLKALFSLDLNLTLDSSTSKKGVDLPLPLGNDQVPVHGQSLSSAPTSQAFPETRVIHKPESVVDELTEVGDGSKKPGTLLRDPGFRVDEKRTISTPLGGCRILPCDDRYAT